MYILAIIGSLMLVESLREIDRAKRNIVVKKNYMFITGYMVFH
jgi:hypothetical protein